MAFDTENIAEQLSQSQGSIFSGLDPQEIDMLIANMTPQTYRDGEVIFQKDDPGDEMYLIISGRIRIYLPDSNGNELTFRYYKQNQTVGELSLLDEQCRSAAAAAAADEGMDSIHTLVLHRKGFLAFLEENPGVGLAMVRDLTNRVRYTTMFLERVMDSISQMMAGDYERALQEVNVSNTDDQIQNLIATFLQMIRSVQARQNDIEAR